jgi:hypothetical protein
MSDDADTLVDPQIRREALPPRADRRRALVLLTIILVTAVFSAGVTIFFALHTTPMRPAPAVTAPDDVAPPAPPVEVVQPVAPVDVVQPVAPVEAVAPEAPRPNTSYQQKGLGRETGPRGD